MIFQDWRFVAASMTAGFLAACGGEPSTPVEAEPLPPQSYGEEESNVELWLDTLELSNRELYAARDAVLAAVAAGPGDKIADLGAGTGLYTLLFAPAVGDEGVVYAVDIEPRFLRLVNQRAADLELRNVVTVLNREDDITLPKGSVDLVFVADTYHYFADPAAVMESVRRSLTKDGRVIILDYDYDEASSSDPHRDHIRFGKEALIDEVESFGFQLALNPEVEGLSDFFMLVFERSAMPPSEDLLPAGQ